ncbi:MAG TPA: TraB/GumN family protein [Paludibacter sp.]|nr:TraB/GumN family protein [Paludibacter sp.]
MKRILFLIFISAQVINLHAQLLWKITGNGLQHPSYLFGTHHLTPIQFLDSIPGLYKAFNSCEVIVSEMVVNNVDATARIQQAAIMPDHIKITDLMNESDCKLVDNELKAVLKFGLKEVSVMNPALILTLYELEMFRKRAGYPNDSQSDSYFQLIAAEKGKKVVGLETVDQQIAILFGNKSFQRQADLLVETIQHKDSVLNEMLLAEKLYKAGKIDELVDLSSHKGNVLDLTEQEYSKLIDERNANWLTQLPSAMQTSPCFIAVGALHLGGKNGLLKKLQKAGYKVNLVKAAGS